MAAVVVGTCRKCCPLWKRTIPFIHPIYAVKRNISVSLPVLAGGKFRKAKGQAADSLAYGPLTDLPDWTYLDGSLPPLSKRQTERQKKRIETATRIVTLLKEVNDAKKKSTDAETTDTVEERT